MRTKLFVFFIFICIMAAFINVNAWAGGCPPGQEWKGAPHWKCVDKPGPSGGNIDIENSAKAYGGDAKAYGGDAEVNIGNGMFNKTLSPEANAKATAGAAAIGFFDVDNEIDMDQKQNQKQNQKQGQVALAIQGQVGINKNDNSNKGNKQTTKVVVEGDSIVYEAEYNHIQPVAGPDTDTQTVKSKASASLTKGSLMDKFDGIAVAGLKRAAKGAVDVELIEAVIFEPKDSVNFIRIGTDGEFAGYIYATCDDTGCPAAGMEAKAMQLAAKLGYTHISKFYEDDAEYLESSEWSLKVGGGASVAASGGSVMIGPGGGVGGGAAESMTVLVPAMTFEVYYNPLYIKEVK